MQLHINPIGGLAGDMFCAALLDIRPDLFPPLRAALGALSPPPETHILLDPVSGPLRGKRFRVELPSPSGTAPVHRRYREIKVLLEGAPLDPGIRTRAQAIFRLLAEAEGRVHGLDPDAVTFHEVGNWDSIIDVVAAAFLLQQLAVTGASTSALPLGGGRVDTAHGLLPVPAPATAALLQGLPLLDDGVDGERVTPTGAAILRALEPKPRMAGTGRLAGTGYGFGCRHLPGIPNCTQILLLQDDETEQRAVGPARADQVLEVAFEVDDQTPEDLATGLDRLRGLEGVLSVTTLAGIGKGGRQIMQIQVLARPERHRRVIETCFRETTTLGVRWRETARWVLPRRTIQVEAERRTCEVKVAQRPGGVISCKTDQRSLKDAGDQRERKRLRELTEGAAGATETGKDEQDG